jgi:hypothetical protein
MDKFHIIQVLTAAYTICRFIVLVFRSWLDWPELWRKYKQRRRKTTQAEIMTGYPLDRLTSSQGDEVTQNELEVQDGQKT